MTDKSRPDTTPTDEQQHKADQLAGREEKRVAKEQAQIAKDTAARTVQADKEQAKQAKAEPQFDPNTTAVDQAGLLPDGTDGRTANTWSPTPTV